MLVRLANQQDARTPRRGLSAEEMDEEEAATRIQSLYRGRCARRKCMARKIERDPRAAARMPDSSGEKQGRRRPDEELQGGEVPGPAEGAPRPMLHGGRSKTLDEMPQSMLTAAGTTDWKAVRAELESRHTTVPIHIQKWRVFAYLLFEEPRSSLPAQVLSMFMLAMILLSVVCFMIETMPELKHVSEDVWLVTEICCTATFTVEYVTRLLVCGVIGTSPWKFVKDTMNIFDLLAILPFYIWLAMRSLKMAKALGVLRVVRLVRLFRIFKLGRYSVGLQLMAEALQNSSQALWVLSFFLCIGILLFSSAIYYVERMGCPDKEDLQGMPHAHDPKSNLTEWDRYMGDCRVSKDGKHTTHGLCCDEHGSPLDFPSIVNAFWWSTVTMTTVGFGEVYPRTELGRVVATGTMLSGILLIALPVAIIGRKFQEVYEKRDMENVGDASASIDYFEEESVSSHQPGSAAKPEGGQAPPEGPTLNEMSRRMRLMKLPDATMTQLALELAEELEEAGDMQKEISSMEKEEKERQVELLQQFDGILKRYMELIDPEGVAKLAKAVGWGNLGKKDPKGLTGLVASAKVRNDQEAAAPPPLPPPTSDPSDDRPAPQSPVKPPGIPASPAKPPGTVESPKSSDRQG